MKNLTHTIVRMGSTGLLAAGLALSLAGCNGTTSKSTAAASEAELSVVEEVEDTSAKDSEASMAPDASAESTAASTTTANLNTSGAIDTTDLFTDRDLAQTADTSEATAITLSSGQDVTIDKEGVYVLSGEASDVTITVEVDDTEKVQLVLDGVSITNEDAPAVYVKNADKVFVTTIEGSTNTLQVTGTFVADGETNTDAVIFSRDDLVLNGQGTLKISSTGNGVTSKDDLKVTGGSYVIDASADALEANESIAIADGIWGGRVTYDSIMNRIYHAKLGKKKYLYSCCNFSLLADAVQRMTHSPLNYYVNNYIFAPLGAYHTLYRPLSKFDRNQIAYTEVDTYLRRQHIHGYVHDELAAFSGGVQGNAGLFSNANDLAKLFQMWLNGGTYGGVRLLKASTVETFTTQKSPNSHRGLGFDKPVVGNPDASNTCPEATPETYGHTGFTGTCFWVDPKNDMFYIFLSNRVSPTRNNPNSGRISARSHINTLIYKAIRE